MYFKEKFIVKDLGISEMCSFKIRHFSLMWEEILKDKKSFYNIVNDCIFDINTLGFYLTAEMNENTIFDDERTKNDIKEIFRGLFIEPDMYYQKYIVKNQLIDYIEGCRDRESIISVLREYDYPYNKKLFNDSKHLERDKISILQSLKADMGYGLFGEILFYSVIRFLFDKSLIISKLYFITAAGTYAHGSDGIFYDSKNKTIIFGEAKFTNDFSSGLSQALSSLADFSSRLNDDYNVIIKSKSALKGNEEIKEEFKTLHKDDIVNYNVEIYVFVLHGAEYEEEKIKEILSKYRGKFKNKINYKINFISFPIISKSELISELARRVEND